MTDATLLSHLDAERLRMARLARRGIGMPMAGMLFWMAVAALTRAFPPETAAIWAFVATGAVFPLGVLLTRVAGGDLFAKSPALTPLGLQLAAVQIFYWPVLILVYNAAPGWVPWTMAVLFGSHFLPYAWLYRSRGYAWLAVSTGVLLTAGAFGTGRSLYTIAPIVAAACYAVAVALLWRECRADEEPRPRAAA